jgi:hypothetical protein
MILSPGFAFCALNADGVPVSSRLSAMDEGRTDQLVFFAFDPLFLNGKSVARQRCDRSAKPRRVDRRLSGCETPAAVDSRKQLLSTFVSRPGLDAIQPRGVQIALLRRSASLLDLPYFVSA